MTTGARDRRRLARPAGPGSGILAFLLALPLPPALAQDPPPGAEGGPPAVGMGGLAGALEEAGLDDARRAPIEAALRTRAYEQAEALLLQAVERAPRSAALLRLLGGVRFVRGEALGAAIAFKKAEALAPLDERSRFTLAMAYVAMGRRTWARPELRALTQANPAQALYVYWTGRLDYDEGQYAAAVEGFRRAIAIDPGFVKAHDNLGLSYEALGRFDDAVASYEAARRLNRAASTPSPWPALNQGLLVVRQGRLDEAEALFRESLGADPAFPQGHYQLGVVLEKQGRYEEAIRALEEAARRDPDYAEPQYALARIYRRRGETARADRALETFSRLKKEKGQANPGTR